MTACTVHPNLAAPRPASLLERVIGALMQYFSRSVVTRDAVDQAWIDSGLGRLSPATLEDIGAPPAMISRAEVLAAWKTAAALDATRHL